MENPWQALSDREFVLAEDKPHVDAYNRGVADKHRLNTTVLPQPFLGRRDAPLVVLALNPGKRGWLEGDYADALREDLQSQQGTAFPALRREFVEEEGKWWKRCLWQVALEAGVPVSSLAYRVLRGERSWSVAVPGLLGSGAYFSSNPRVGVISAATIGEQEFSRAVEAVRSVGGAPTTANPRRELPRLAASLAGRYPMVDQAELFQAVIALANQGLTPTEVELEFIRLASKPVAPISDWF